MFVSERGCANQAFAKEARKCSNESQANISVIMEKRIEVR